MLHTQKPSLLVIREPASALDNNNAACLRDGLSRQRSDNKDPGDYEACSSPPSAANLISALFVATPAARIFVAVVMAVAATGT